MQLQLNTYIIFLTVFLFTFCNIRGSYACYLILMILGSTMNKYSQNLIVKPIDSINFLLVTLVLIFAGFTSYYTLVLWERINKNNIAKNRFKKIMDMSEEGIVIIKEKTIEYVNDQFIKQQKNSILQFFYLDDRFPLFLLSIIFQLRLQICFLRLADAPSGALLLGSGSFCFICFLQWLAEKKIVIYVL